MTLRSNDSRNKRALGRRRPQIARLRLEQLEDRLTPASSGSLDTTFGTGGMVTTPFGSAADDGKAVAIDSSGRIVVAGTTFNGTNDDFAVARYLPTGALDTSFGTGGKVTTSFGASGDELVTSVAIDSSGRIFVAGSTSGTGGVDFAIACYSSSGTLDTTFGTAGKVVTAFGAGTANDEITDMAIDGNGRIVVVGFTATSSNNLGFAVARYTSNGTLDTSFDSDGKVMVSFGSTQDIAQDVAIDGSGNIVVVGKTFSGSSTDFAIVRLTPAGALDTTFGGGTGKAITAFGALNAAAVGVAIDGSGRIVVAGTASNGSQSDFAVARYTSAGVLDTNFGSGGEVTNDFSALSSTVPEGVAAGVVLDNAGRVVVVGSAVGTSSSKFAIARYTTSGVLDASFGSGGEALLGIGTVSSGAAGGAIDGAGRIVAAGFASNGSNDDFAVARFIGDMPPVITSNGGGATANVSAPENATAVTTVTASDPDPNTTFSYSITGGTDASAFTINAATGALTFVSAPNFEAPTDANGDGIYGVTVAVSDGYQLATQTIAVTVTNVNEAPTFSSGAGPDPTFGVSGIQPTALPAGVNVTGQNAQNITVDSSGRFVVVGKTAGNSFAIVRYLPTGAIDTSFGTNGSVTTAIGSNNLSGQCVTIDSLGRILLGGFVTGSSVEFAIARYSSAGVLDTGWGSSGLQVTPIGTSAQIESIVIDGAGGTIAVGKATVGGRLDVAMVRYTTTGLVDATFGSSGTVTAALGSSCNADSIAIDSTGKIVIAGEEVNGGGQQVMMVARYTSAGVLDTTFNTTGVQTATIGAGSSNASLVAIDGSNRIVIAGSGGSSFAMARFSSTGAIDSTFGSAGIVNTAIGSGAAAIESLTFDASGRIVVAGFSTAGAITAYTTARYASAGTLDATFGSAGIVTTTLAASSSAGKVTIDGSNRILVAGVSGNTFELARYIANVSVVSVAEDTTAVVAAGATDPDASSTLTYSLTGGTDVAKFSIDSGTGLIHFLTPPDFEVPADSNADNIYNLTEQVTDGSFTAMQSVSVTVTNVTAANSTVCVSAAWANLASGTVIADADPTVSGNQPATLGVNGFAIIPGGLEALTPGGTIVLLPGAYAQDVTFSSAISLSVPTGTATITGAVGGSFGLTKTGAGTLTLTAANGYTGGTTVSAGSLLVDGSIAQSSGVTVAAAATLGGTGSAGNSVTSSGIIAPGDAAPGTLSAIILSLGTGTLALDLASAASYDRLSGSFINITGTTLSLNVGTVNDNDTYTILSVAGTSGGLTGTFVNLPQNATFAIGSRTFRINYAGGDGNNVVLTALPNSSLSVVSRTLNSGIPYISSTLASHQHSMVENVVYSFSQAVNLTAANFSLTGFQGTPASLVPNVNVSSSSGGTVWTVTFSGVGVNGGTHSIGDGEYQLVLVGIPGAPANTFDFFRLLGDMDGDGTVSASDFSTLIGSFLRPTSDPAFLGADDFDGDGTIGASDLSQFTANFLHSLPTPLPN